MRFQLPFSISHDLSPSLSLPYSLREVTADFFTYNKIIPGFFILADLVSRTHGLNIWH